MTLKTFNKKGISDGLIWAILLLVVFVFAVIGFIVMSSLNTAIQDSNLGNTSKQITSDFTTDFPLIFDGLFITFFFGLLLASFLASILIDTNPAVYFIGIVIFILILVIGMFMANAAIEFSEEASIAGYASSFPMTLFIFNNFVVILVVYIAILSVVIWGKLRG